MNKLIWSALILSMAAIAMGCASGDSGATPTPIIQEVVKEVIKEVQEHA